MPAASAVATDGLNAYPDAVEKAFGANVDYAVLNKSYEGGLPAVEAKRRYSPAVCLGATKNVVTGSPEMKMVSTSHVERASLSMRMDMRRFTRLTKAFSKKIENHMHAISFYFMAYNFVKIHSTVRCSPAMAAGVTDTLWSIEDIVMMADTMETNV